MNDAASLAQHQVRPAALTRSGYRVPCACVVRVLRERALRHRRQHPRHIATLPPGWLMPLAAPVYLLPTCSAAAARRPRARTPRFAARLSSRSATAAVMAADDEPTPLVANCMPPWSLSMSARDGAPAFLGTVFAVGTPKAKGAVDAGGPCRAARRMHARRMHTARTQDAHCCHSRTHEECLQSTQRPKRIDCSRPGMACLACCMRSGIN